MSIIPKTPNYAHPPALHYAQQQQSSYYANYAQPSALNYAQPPAFKQAPAKS
jgi:hypothetical protein